MRRFLFIPIIILFAACNSNSNSNKSAEAGINSDTLQPKVDSVSIKKASTVQIKGTDELIGIWAKSDSDNASFEISKTTFYYPEHDKYYKYHIVGDSIRIKYDDYEDSFAFKFKGSDTLILNGLYGEQIYKRRK